MHYIDTDIRKYTTRTIIVEFIIQLLYHYMVYDTFIHFNSYLIFIF